MTSDELLNLLRQATEHDVTRALVGSHIALPIETPADVLEIFDRMLSELTNERVSAVAIDEAQVAWPPTFRLGAD